VPSSSRRSDRYMRTSRLENAVRFAKVGVFSTVAYAALFLVLRLAFDVFEANALALVVCSVANLVVHHRLALLDAREHPRGRSALFLGAIAGFATILALTTAALLVAGWISEGSWFVSVMALGLATACAGVIRFALLSTVVFRARSNSVARREEPSEEAR
jgi:putative flippase GtrA